MFIARSEYDRGINTFSPEGRLFQVEYSLEAIKLGSTAIGVTTAEGVILGVEKRITSSLLETSSVEKVVEIDRHIGCAMSGLQADARSMIGESLLHYPQRNISQEQGMYMLILVWFRTRPHHLPIPRLQLQRAHQSRVLHPGHLRPRPALRREREW